MEICVKCEMKMQCDTICAAAQELQKIYDQNKHKEKVALIRRLRKLLDVQDAEPAPDLQALAKKIIKKLPELHHILDFDIKVGYVRSYERKTKDGKATLGDCRKVNTVYGAYLPFDFIITIYDMNVGHLSDNQIKILMLHELKHIGIGDRGFCIVPHDIEDFLDITDEHSTRWNELGAEVADILG